MVVYINLIMSAIGIIGIIGGITFLIYMIIVQRRQDDEMIRCLSRSALRRRLMMERIFKEDEDKRRTE